MVFLILVGVFVLIGFLIADHKKTMARNKETTGDRCLRLAAGSWKAASPPHRFLALTSAGVEPNYAETIVNLEWRQVPVRAQLALANFQAAMEIDPDTFANRTGE